MTIKGAWKRKHRNLFQEDFWPAAFMKIMLGGRYEMFDGDLTNNLTDTNSSYSEEIFNPKAGLLITPLDGLDFFANVQSLSMAFSP